MLCIIKSEKKLIDYSHRKSSGDIRVRTYCYSKNGKKVTHATCGKNEIVYKNGEGYALTRKILYNDRFINLIGCWCNDNLRFETPVEAQNHRMQKHPEEFE